MLHSHEVGYILRKVTDLHSKILNDRMGRMTVVENKEYAVRIELFGQIDPGDFLFSPDDIVELESTMNMKWEFHEKFSTS